MTITRTAVPPAATLVVTDAGLETWLLFERGVELPAFAAYPFAASADGRNLLTEYYEAFVAIAEDTSAAVLLETPTWRANPDWGATLGHDRATLAALIRASVEVVDDVRRRYRGRAPFLTGGAVGPRGDGYRVDAAMDVDTAAQCGGHRVGVHELIAEVPTLATSSATGGASNLRRLA